MKQIKELLEKPKAWLAGFRKDESGKGIVGRDIDVIRNIQTAIPFPVILGVLIAALALEVLVVVQVLTIGLLPGKYILLVIVILVAIDIGILALILNRKRGKKRFYAGMIATVLMMIMLLPCCYFMYTTGDALQKLTTLHEQFEEYQVIALKDGSYDELEDIKKQKVCSIKNKSKMNEEARERLVTAADVTYKDEKDIVSLGSELIDAKGNKHDNLILTSESYYDMLCEENKDFKKNTKVVYSMQVKKRSSANGRKVNVTTDPFNVYVTGIDAWGSIDKVSRSDVNMIVTVNPQTRQILMTSIPRDCYIPLHTFGEMDKLTHSGIYGVDETIATVEDWLDIDLDYYVKVNFTMVVKIVNAIGGIRVYSDKEFDSAISKYHYYKGWNIVHGKSALYFARERKAFEKGDQARIKNQQQVLKGIITKITSSRVLLTNYTELLDIVTENMTTNMSRRDMNKLVRMQLRDMDKKWSIKMNSIKCTEASKGTYSMGMGRELYVVIPQEDSVEKAKQMIHDVMYPAQVLEDDPKNLLP